MRSIFEKLAKYALLRGIVYIAFGVLMLLAPQTVMNTIVYILAGYAIAMGALNIFAYFRERPAGFMDFNLVSGVMLVVLGVVMIIFTKAILSILPIFLGVLLILGGIARLAEAISATSQLGGAKILLIVLGLLIIIGGIVVVANPFGSAVLLFRAFGVLVVVQGIGEVASYFSFRRLGK